MGDTQDLELFLFNQIPSSRKSYNKILDKNTQSFESRPTIEGKKEFFQQSDNALTGKFRAQDADEDNVLEDTNQINDELQEAGPKDGEKRQKRVYDRGAADMAASFDESAYFKQRNTKLAQLAKKDNHLLLYSNVNTLDFIDINQSDVAKAWTILFHFRSKSIESMLFEEFNSIA